MGGKFTSGERRGLIALLIVVGLVWMAVIITRQCDRGESAQATAEPTMTVRADTLHDTLQTRNHAQRSRRKVKSRSKTTSAPGRQRSFLDEDIPVKQQ